MTLSPAVFDSHVLAFDIAGFLQALAKSTHHIRIFSGECAIEKSDHRHRGLLRARRERPCSRRAAEQRDELPAPHSMTSSARESSVGGMVRPSILAVFVLMTNRSLVGNSTGKSAGLAPFRIFATKS